MPLDRPLIARSVKNQVGFFPNIGLSFQREAELAYKTLDFRHAAFYCLSKQSQ
jgi:hypothetical protein